MLEMRIAFISILLRRLAYRLKLRSLSCYGSTEHNTVGAPLALYGDVIVVTINYRLGILGFLTDGQGEALPM